MGHRANLILVENDDYQLFYCHWCALSIPQEVFWGPRFALGFMRQQNAVNKNDWLDDVWAEGGVLIDIQKQALLVWGGESLNYDVVLRRMYLALLQENWQGWETRWAYDGIFDLAEYVSLAREEVQSGHDFAELEQRALSLELSEEADDWVNVVGSAALADNTIKLFPLQNNVANYLNHGPAAMVEAVQQTAGVDQMDWDEWSEDFPKEGFHLDIPNQELSFWAASEFGLSMDKLHERWPGWKIRRLGDNFEYQLEQTRGLLTFPVIPEADILEHLRSILMQSSKSSGPEIIRRLLGEDQLKGNDVQINPYALEDDPLDLPLEIRERIFDEAVEAWRRRTMGE
jgi:hypothetical protein